MAVTVEKACFSQVLLSGSEGFSSQDIFKGVGASISFFLKFISLLIVFFLPIFA